VLIVKITFLGAAKTVTGSCFLVECENNIKFLVDCGMFQGYAIEDALNEQPFPFNPSELDFMLLTHAHVDHSGRIPKLYKDGFNGPVYATKATAELCSLMLPDSGHIQEMENEWTNRKRARAGKPPVEPLYTHQDALDCLKIFESVRYGDLISPAEGIRVRFNDAGHVLGSSIIEIWVEENGKETKVVFSGDLGNKDLPILRDPSIIDSADYLVIESTYGDRLHNENEKKFERFIDIINETIENGGNVVIPSFAVGRTQEIIYQLNKQIDIFGNKLQKLNQIPVYIDSPLAVSATEVFRNNLDCFDEEARSYIENGDNPLDFANLHFTKTVDESKALNMREDNVIIVSASGMCEAGRIKHHLKHNLWRKKCTVLFVGYQAEGTLGRRLIDGAKKVKIFGEEITVNARIEKIEGFSGHADLDGLLGWIDKFSEKPKKIFIVHGEEEAMKNFASSIEQRFGIDAIIPERGESFSFDAIHEVRSVGMLKTTIRDEFKVLAIIDYIETIKEEISELEEILKSDLRKGKTDSDLDKLKAKLKNLENAIVDAIK